MELPLERDCTSKCHSSVHAKQILNCAIKAAPSQVRAYSVWLCHNFSIITDELGRNLLHIAASCGKWEIVEWLLHQCNVDVDSKDLESGWTALHRSFFYGQLASARILTNHGASLRVTDHEGLTPLDIMLKDRLPYVEHLPTNPSEVYAWGSNFNYNLGLGNMQSRINPEILEVFRKDFISIKQVVICKFHSVFLSVGGKVFTCGYGHGGRLGQGSEDTALIPSLVKGLGSFCCTQLAAGQDHLLLLLEGGQVWSCGLNTYHQLGHNPPLERVVTPKPISLKFLKGKQVVGLRAARFHSVIYTKDSLYTFGLNAGQLGHSKGDRTQIQPRQVSSLYNEDWCINHVEASDGATVCATSRGDVYVLHEYQYRKIASRQLEILRLSVVGGHLDSRCDVAGVREGGGLELRVILLTKSGKVYLWRQTDPHLRRCLFSSTKQLIISDIHINHYSIGMITVDNEGYMGHIIPFKGQRSAPSSTVPSLPTAFTSGSQTGLNILLNREDCNFIRVKRLLHIHRGTTITSDSKGRNFAVLQSSPKMGLVELPMISHSEMEKNLNRLLLETNTQDDFHDIIIKVGKREFAAHKYILASRCDYFRKQFSDENSALKNHENLSLDNIRPEAFDQILKFIYCNHCDFLVSGYEVKWGTEAENTKQKKKSSSKKNCSNSGDPLKLMQEASRKLNMHVLTKRLDDVRLINGKIEVIETSPLPKLTFDRQALLHLSDVNLCSVNGTVFRCHKCILVSQLAYFHSMLSSCWVENSQLGQLSFPISSEVMDTVLDYLYTERASRVFESEDAEFVCHVLMVSDQLLIIRLKEICEMALVELITLKNASELLELSFVYNSVQLKQSSMQFICINLPAIVEAKSLDILSNEAITELSLTYRCLISSMSRRVIMSNLNEPSQEDLIFVGVNYPIADDCLMEKCKPDLVGSKCHENKSKSKRRSHLARLESKDDSPSCRKKLDSESSEKDIVLDIVVTDAKDIELAQQSSVSSPKAFERRTSESTDIPTGKRPGQWVMKYPKPELEPDLDKIMLEEMKRLTVLQKAVIGHEIKPLPHMSQKQKKLLVTSKKNTESITTDLAMPQSKSSCPWANTIQQSPPSPSFWDTLNRRDCQSSLENSDKTVLDNMQGNGLEPEECKHLDISLDAIQKAEELKLRSENNPKIKPLRIINVEEQAIEELLILYNAKDNPKERVTVSRVLSEEVASPVWKRHA